MSIWPWRRQGEADRALMLGLANAQSREHEAIKVSIDQLSREIRLLRTRLERVDGRMERAEIRMLSIDPSYPETQASLPDDVLVATRRRLDAGLPPERT
jgi:hypothetical protein